MEKVKFSEVLLYAGAFLLGFSLTWIFGFFKGVSLAIAIDSLILSAKSEILDKIDSLKLRSKR